MNLKKIMDSQWTFEMMTLHCFDVMQMWIQKLCHSNVKIFENTPLSNEEFKNKTYSNFPNTINFIVFLLFIVHFTLYSNFHMNFWTNHMSIVIRRWYTNNFDFKNNIQL
jgi:hypothetical protein